MAEALKDDEIRELEGLLARNSRGRVSRGTPEWDRMEWLIRVRDFGERAGEPSRKWLPEKVMEFYGIRKRCFDGLKALGKQINQAPPWDDAVAMVAWFDELRGRGLRTQKAPGLFLQRADEQRMAGMRSPVPPPASKSPQNAPISAQNRPAAPVSASFPAQNPPSSSASAPESPDSTPAGDPLVLGGENTPAETISLLRKLARAQGQKHIELIELGDTPAAETAWHAWQRTLDKLRQWEQGASKMRDSELWHHEDEIRAAGTAFCSGIWRMIRKELPELLPHDMRITIDLALDRLAARVPDLIPALLSPDADAVAKAA